MFSAEISKYIDADNLIGAYPEPSPQSSGNPLVLCAVFCILAKDNKCDDFTLYEKVIKGIKSLQVKSGIINKKARSLDEVTHDDLISFSACNALVNNQLSNDRLIYFGLNHSWIMSNTDKNYIEAIARPWDVAFYKLISGYRISFFSYLLLCGEIFIDALFNKDNPGSKQLIWIKLKSLTNKSKLLLKVTNFWYQRTKKFFGSIANVLAQYHGKDHPFAVYCIE